MDRKPLKIALIRRKFNPQKGGAEKVAGRFVEMFTGRGHTITVIAEQFVGRETDQLKWAKVPKRGPFAWSKTESFHLRAQKILDTDNLRDSFDIVYSMCKTTPVDIFRVTEDLHPITMKLMHGPFAKFNPRHRSILKIEKEVFCGGGIRHLVSNSQMIKRQLIELFDCADDKITIINNGVDPQRFYPPTPEEKKKLRDDLKINDRFICLFPAWNFKLKGLDKAIFALSRLPKEMNDKYLLMIVGGDNFKPYLNLASSLGIGRSICYMGPQRKMRDFYSLSDILLFPSTYETFSNVVLEACACGLPVLTTKQIGAAQLIDDNRNGFLVENNDKIDQMGEILTNYIALPEAEKMRFSQAALEATKGYRWNLHTDQMENLFYKVLEEKNKF
jgi:UDP-glucose:(heptosyl)LPS alpha-1,3-glucosyltransferase